jgi:large subunit ribosomal protein L32
MPHPTRRFSKTRTLKRRTNDKAKDPTVAVCSNCGAPVVYHRVCTECGYYKGKPAIEKTESEKKK